MSELHNKEKVGCIFGILTLLVVTPLWFAILYGLLTACDADTWVWVLFWVYLPAHFVLAAARVIGEAVVE